LYFDLGEGKDYLYEYKGEFIGISQNDILMPTAFQKSRFNVERVSEIFPKYYIIKAKNFKKLKIERSFDEWVYFLQKSEIPDDFHAKGIDQAREKLKYEKMPDLDKQVYQRHIENRRIEMAVKETAEIEGRKKEKVMIAQNLKSLGLPTETIAQATGLTPEEINEL
jgi:predicted transposase/invertase (TIGR01784 family)